MSGSKGKFTKHAALKAVVITRVKKLTQMYCNFFSRSITVHYLNITGQLLI